MEVCIVNSVIVLANYDHKTLHIGDMVAEEVIDYFRNNLSPATDWSSLFQSGGVSCDRITPDGRLRPAFSTFKRVAEGIWCYCGECLKGESKERGEIPSYEK